MHNWRSRYQNQIAEGTNKFERRFRKQSLALLLEAEKTAIDSPRFPGIIEDIYNAVLTFTQGECAWYMDLIETLNDLFAACGMTLSDRQKQEVAAWVTTYCHSWSEPEETEAAIFLAGFTQKLRRFARPTPNADRLFYDFLAGSAPESIAQWLDLVARLLKQRPTELKNIRLGCYCAKESRFIATLVGKNPAHQQPWHGALFIEAATATVTVLLFEEHQPLAEATPLESASNTVAATWRWEPPDSWFHQTNDTPVIANPMPTALAVTAQTYHRSSTWLDLELDLSAFAFDKQAPHFPDTLPVFGIALLEPHKPASPNVTSRGLFLTPETYLWRQAQSENRYSVTYGALEHGDYRIILRIENLFHPDWGYGSWLSEPCDFLVRPPEILPWPKGRQKSFLSWPWGNLKRSLK